MQFIDLKQQLSRIEDQVFAGIQRVLRHGAYVMGPEVDALEKKLADRVGVEHALTVSSGTDALMIALMALGIGPGDEVITSPFSFFATVEVIVLLGAKPVFVDIEPDTYNIDASLIEAAITPKTKAILPVSLYGQCADMDAINAIAAQYQLPVIEDAAQSFGATYKGRPSCSLSTIACTSFFPSKPLGCYGDGGACFTQDAVLAQRINEIRLHGQSKRYYHTRIGVNGRFDTIQAAILLEKLALFDEEVALRQTVAARYQQLLPTHIPTQVIRPHSQSVFAQYTLAVENRDSVQAKLQARGIPTAVHYPLGLHQQPVFEALFDKVVFPVTEQAARTVISIPMHPYLTVAEQEKIVAALIEATTEKSAMTESVAATV